MKKLLMITMVLLAQIGFSQLPPDDKKFSMPDIPPQYAGGETAMIKFIADNLKINPEVNYDGTVVAQFTVDSTGNVTKADIIRGGHPLVNDYVLKTVKRLQFKPALVNGKHDDYIMMIPIRLKTGAGE